MNGDVILLLSMLFSCNLRRRLFGTKMSYIPKKDVRLILLTILGQLDSMLVGDTIFWQSSLKFVNYDSLAT